MVFLAICYLIEASLGGCVISAKRHFAHALLWWYITRSIRYFGDAVVSHFRERSVRKSMVLKVD